MKEIDARGLRCPLPIIELGKQISTLSSGDEIMLFSDDPATEPDLNAWSRMTGNHFSKVADSTFLITKD
jgi:tRNA 2-thiouridine synthesizing protein A